MGCCEMSCWTLTFIFAVVAQLRMRSWAGGVVIGWLGMVIIVVVNT